VQKKSQFSLCRSAVLVGNQSEHVLKKEKKQDQVLNVASSIN
jgi:hypothetical protein